MCDDKQDNKARADRGGTWGAEAPSLQFWFTGRALYIQLCKFWVSTLHSLAGLHQNDQLSSMAHHKSTLNSLGKELERGGPFKDRLALVEQSPIYSNRTVM